MIFDLPADMPLLSPDFLAVITILQEASGEQNLGKLAVAEVIRNRTLLKHGSDGMIFSDGTVPGTVLWPAQFSGWNSTGLNGLYRIRTASVKLDDPEVLECIRAWKSAINVKTNIVLGATHYFNPDIVIPPWKGSFKFLVKVGRHEFYK